MKYIFVLAAFFLFTLISYASSEIDNFIGRQFSCELFDKTGKQIEVEKKHKAKLIRPTLEMFRVGYRDKYYMKYSEAKFDQVQSMSIVGGAFEFILANQNQLQCMETKVREKTADKESTPTKLDRLADSFLASVLELDPENKEDTKIAKRAKMELFSSFNYDTSKNTWTFREHHWLKIEKDSQSYKNLKKILCEDTFGIKDNQPQSLPFWMDKHSSNNRLQLGLYHNGKVYSLDIANKEVSNIYERAIEENFSGLDIDPHLWVWFVQGKIEGTNSSFKTQTIKCLEE